MSEHPTALFVGLGSPHGDDQIGWLVADRLANTKNLSSRWSIRKAAIPLDLLDWLEGIQFLGICDALDPSSAKEGIQRGEWSRNSEPNPTAVLPLLNRMKTGNSHSFQLAEVLDLANTLNRLPSQLVVWAIPAIQCEPEQPLSDELQKQLPTYCDQILFELIHL